MDIQQLTFEYMVKNKLNSMTLIIDDPVLIESCDQTQFAKWFHDQATHKGNDKFTVSINNKHVAPQDCLEYCCGTMLPDILPYPEVKLSELFGLEPRRVENRGKCTCLIVDIMRYGCKCGGI